MQNPPWLDHDASFPAPPPPPPPQPAPATFRPRRISAVLPGILPVMAAAAILGILLGGRAAAEDGRTAAAAALASGDPARAVGLDEAVAGRSGFLMLLDPGASAAAEHDAQLARIGWAKRLAQVGQVDSAVAVLAAVGESSLIGTAEAARAQILVAAATAAAQAGQPELALLRLDQAARGSPPAPMAATIAAMRATDEVEAATVQVASGRAAGAVALLDDAAAHGAGAAAATVYPSALLAAGREEAADLDFQEAGAALLRLTVSFGASSQARTARTLLRAPQTVSGTLVSTAGHPASGRVRLSTHFTQLAGGYVTTGPFYSGSADSNGDFAIAAVPVGGPYVLEYFRDGGWMTLIDPRTGQPANPVLVSPMVPEDLTFITLPG
jgi:hypothetical protein